MPAASKNFNENDPGIVVHGAVASVARPVYHGPIFWIGTVNPTNKLTNDVWINPSGSTGSSIITAVKTANESVTSSTALQDDDHLLAALAANTNYAFRLSLFLTTSSSTPEFKVGLTVPASTGLIWHGFIMDMDGIPTAAGLKTGTFPITTSGATVTVEMSTDPILMVIEGSARVGATAGNLQLQWAQDVSNATAMTVLAGSTLVVTQA